MSDFISRQAAIDCVTTGAKPMTIRGRIAELPSAQPERRWIPMSEREPEFGDYLTTYIEKETGKLGVTTDMYWSGGWDDDCDEFETLAWMPLPAPWRGEEHGE